MSQPPGDGLWIDSENIGKTWVLVIGEVIQFLDFSSEKCEKEARLWGSVSLVRGSVLAYCLLLNGRGLHWPGDKIETHKSLPIIAQQRGIRRESHPPCFPTPQASRRLCDSSGSESLTSGRQVRSIPVAYGHVAVAAQLIQALHWRGAVCRSGLRRATCILRSY